MTWGLGIGKDKVSFQSKNKMAPSSGSDRGREGVCMCVVNVLW